MADVFISHAVADKVLADLFVKFLKEAIGLPAKSIFCSSVEGHGIPLGVNFNDYLKQRIKKPKLVILLMTEAYMESAFCLMELGAAWVQSSETLPIVVPPVPFATVTKTLGLTQAWNIEKYGGLIDLKARIQKAAIPLEPRTEHDWDAKRSEWRTQLKKVQKGLPKATKVSAEEYLAANEKLEEQTEEIMDLEGLLETANKRIAALEKLKDAKEVKAVAKQFSNIETIEAEFNELIEAVLMARPTHASTEVSLHIIMDHFGKAGQINWYDHDTKAQFESGIQYNLLHGDDYSVAWNGPKLKKLRKTLNDVVKFLGSSDGHKLVEQMDEGIPMEPDDREFWEHHLS